ncbi:MAG: hypothetical protein WAK93_02775 [Solirubrobacteraceae bacterium]
MRTGARLAAVAGLAAISIVFAAGCGGSGGSTTAASTMSSTSNATTTKTTSSNAGGRQPRRPGVPVGQAQLVHAGSSTLSVRVSRVLDPLRDAGAQGPPGTHPVGVLLSVHNLRGETYDSTASGDVSIEPSSGMAAPLFVKHGVCQTPLTDFESLIGVGETRTGCVGFAIPRGARVIVVRFSPHSRARGTVSWH